jgi:hypothetical protein
VELLHMAEFLGGAPEEEESAAAQRIQACHRGKRARRRVGAKSARSLAQSVKVMEELGQVRRPLRPSRRPF